MKKERYHFPRPEMAESVDDAETGPADIYRIEVLREEIRIETMSSHQFFYGPGEQFPLYLLHKIVQAKRRNRHCQWTFSDAPPIIYDIDAPDYSLPWRRFAPLSPQLNGREVQTFDITFTALQVVFQNGYHIGFPELGLYLCSEDGCMYHLRVDDEVHTLMRMVELRHWRGAWTATGVRQDANRYGEISRLLGPGGEVLGSNSEWG